MSELSQPHSESASFSEQVETLIQELDLALRWKRPCVLMVAYGSVYVRADSVSMLENFMMDRDQKIVWIHAGNSVVSSLEFWYKILDDAENVVFFLDGLTDLTVQGDFRDVLNHYAYLFIEKNARLVFWLTYKEASAMAYHAPGLWYERQLLIDLTASPKPEQILQNALESVWQGTGEYTDHYEDTEEKISLRESFLNGLPESNETTSIRANLLLTLGVLHWRKGDYEKASEMLRNALKCAAQIQDNWFEAKCFNAVALVESSLGKNEEAIESYKQAIRLAPRQIFVWNNLGNLCLKINRNDEALIAFQKAIEHNPADPMAWNGVGDVYSRSEYVDDAVTAYRKAIALAPSLPHPWHGLGEIYARSGRFNESVTAFHNAIGINSHFLAPRLSLAKLYGSQKRYREAAKAYQQALLLDPKNSSIWNDLGCIWLDAGQYQDALETISKAIELDRGLGWAYSNLGLAYVGCEKLSESIPLYLKSLELLRDEGQRRLTWNRLADAYRLMNNYVNAIKAYQMADSMIMKNSLTINSASTDSKPFGQIQVEPDSVSETVSTTETESGQPEERSEASPVEDQAIRPEQNPEEETQYWIFHHAIESETASDFIGSSSHAFGSAIVKSITLEPEIGGLTMQMTLPFTASNDLSTSALFQSARVKPRAHKADTSNARMWNEKGNLLLRAGAIEDAIKAYNTAISHDRSFGWSYTNMGIAYLHLERYAEAVLLLQKSLELLATDKERAVAWNELGNLYRCLKDYHNAVVSYQKADELNPDHAGVGDKVEYLHAEPNAGNAQVWNELGDSFYKAGSYPEAEDCYRKSTEMEPLKEWTFVKLASSLTFQSKFEDAINVYKNCLELFTNDKDKADVWNRLGNVYRRVNDYENAIAAYQSAVKLNNENKALLTRARFSLLGNCYVD